jgi:hypothetical protein
LESNAIGTGGLAARVINRGNFILILKNFREFPKTTTGLK